MRENYSFRKVKLFPATSLIESRYLRTRERLNIRYEEGMAARKGSLNRWKHLVPVVCTKSRIPRKTNITGFLLERECARKKKTAPIVFLLFLSLVSTSRSMHRSSFFLLFSRDRRGGLLTPSTNVRQSKCRHFFVLYAIFQPYHHPSPLILHPHDL